MTDWKMLSLFEREANVLAQLDFPGIPKYIEYFHTDTDTDRSFYIAIILTITLANYYKWALLDIFGFAPPASICSNTLAIRSYLDQTNKPNAVVHDLEISMYKVNSLSLISCAAINSNYFGVKLLITRGAYVNVKDIYGRTPLHLISDGYSLITFDSVVSLLVDNGADINAKNEAGQIPLHIISAQQHHLKYTADTIEFLLEKGANINAKDNQGKTPLALTRINSQKNNTESIEYQKLIQLFQKKRC